MLTVVANLFIGPASHSLGKDAMVDIRRASGRYGVLMPRLYPALITVSAGISGRGAAAAVGM